MNKATLTVLEFALALNISKTKAYQVIHTDGIGTIRIGSCIRIPVQEFEEWLRKNTKKD
jgi:excisionase family DNA binding protein